VQGTFENNTYNQFEASLDSPWGEDQNEYLSFRAVASNGYGPLPYQCVDYANSTLFQACTWSRDSAQRFYLELPQEIIKSSTINLDLSSATVSKQRYFVESKTIKNRDKKAASISFSANYSGEIQYETVKQLSSLRI